MYARAPAIQRFSPPSAYSSKAKTTPKEHQRNTKEASEELLEGRMYSVSAVVIHRFFSFLLFVLSGATV